MSSFIQNGSFCQRDINTHCAFNIVASVPDNKRLRMEGGEFGSCVVTSINTRDGMAGYFELSTKAEEKEWLGIKRIKPRLPSNPSELIAARSGEVLSSGFVIFGF